MENLSAKARVRIRKPPPEVFRAFADAGWMSKFWFTRRDGGLEEGQPSTWYLGGGPDAVSFEVFVTELSEPHKIAIEWENGGATTRVTWSIEETEQGDSILTIEETGFAGGQEARIERAL
ncbi:MAG: SRPBCC domain-containing protein, partial [Anaerolineales bacterium]|nr:SRPBCC domain-containing protein [Anaerolineales bacterium]